MTDFNPRRDVQAISHINVVVNDIEVATEFYRTVLGFEQAANADGPMDYRGVDLASFARDAGFDDGRVSLDVRFLKHPEVGVYLELFTYHHPKGDQTIHRRKTNDLGGIRHRELHAAERNILFVLEEFGAVIGVHRCVDRTGGDGIDPHPF